MKLYVPQLAASGASSVPVTVSTGGTVFFDPVEFYRGRKFTNET